MRITKTLPIEMLDDCRRRFAAGETDEQVIAHLRQRGFSKAETIKLLADLGRVSLGQAKRLVHLSAAWKDVYARDERVHDVVERVARTMNRKPKPKDH